MNPLPKSATDSELIALVDVWASLLEREDYKAAYLFTDHIPTQNWSPSLLKDVIKTYGKADPSQRVTVFATQADTRQRKNVTRWPTNPDGCFGQIWYDLNIDGHPSDLTALFDLRWRSDGVLVCLDDIHAM